jgi:hypothetical protein
MSKYLPFASVGAVCLAVGIMLGLAIGKLNRGTEISAIQEKLLEEQDHNMYLESCWAKTSVLLDMVQEIDGIKELCRTPEFRAKFKPNWYEPKEFSKLLGYKWLIREIVSQKVAPPESFGDNFGYDPKEYEERAKKLLKP